MGARDFIVQVGPVETPCRLPLIPTRMALVYADDSARKVQDEDTRIYLVTCTLSAALGLSMAVPLECGVLATFRGDVIAYGEAAADELTGGDPRRLADVTRAGRAAMERILQSIPTRQGEEAALDPTGAPAASSTDDSSASE
jgi:hypothetical protein